MSQIDIIIPVYRGIAETRACLESVLAARNSQPSEIVVMNDASPEAEIHAYLEKLAKSVRITLVTNPANLGFVATCNRAMQLHPDRDVLLLNSDTVVTDGWLDRMASCAASLPQVASVTPFSNNATLCSYPRIAHSNALSQDKPLAELDQVFASVNIGRHVQIPTGVGFCMLLTRSAINAVGLFDTEAFGRGYGEENDWCMRAGEQGYAHLLCADLFVYHKGEVSFAGDAVAGKATAQSVIDARYPEYNATIARHLEADPARPLRRRVDLARLASSQRPRVLFIAHNWGGGTEKHVADLARLTVSSLEILLFKPHDEQNLSLRWMREGEEFEAFFEDRNDPAELLNVLRMAGISRVHLHHVHGLPQYVLDLHTMLGVPLDITLHDYFPITPRYHLGFGGALEASSHESGAQNDWQLSDEQWRARMGKLLDSAERVIAPSQDLAGVLRGYFPAINFQVRGHPDVIPEAAGKMRPYTVMVLGGLTPEKGLNLLDACARDARDRKLPLFFKLLGHTAGKLVQFPGAPLSISGTYSEADLDYLIALEKPDAFLFPSQIPESFSYTLTTALRFGLPVVASALGAFKERLENNPRARTLAWNAPATAWNDALLEMAAKRPADAVVPARESFTAAAQGAHAYADWYLQPFRGAAAATSVITDIAPRIWYQAKIRGPRKQYSLQQLFDVGVDCGHAPSLSELRRRTAIADLQIERAARELPEAQRRIDTLNREIDSLRVRYAAMQGRLEAEREVIRVTYDSIVSSTTWRMTSPLRSVITGVRNARTNVSGLMGVVLRTPGALRSAFGVLRSKGLRAVPGHLRAQLRPPSRMPAFNAGATNYRLETAITPLSIDTAATPVFSLVIPVYGQHLLTFTCLKSIAETCAGLAIEVLVIDDCSPEPAAEALRKVSGINVIRNARNLGFLASCNHGASKARGEYVVILNNDLILTGDWLKKLVSVYDNFPDTGMVGAKLIYPDGTLQEAGGVVWRDGSAWNVGRGDDPGKPEYNFVREVDYCSGACLLIKRDFWNTLGGFDVAYMPAYYEDADLAFRVREAGKRVFYQPLAVVVHFEGQSSGTDLTKGIKKHQVINQKTFAQRWEVVLAGHRANGVEPVLEQNRYTGKRILVVDACMLTPDQDAGSMRMFEMLALMRGLGYRVTFIAANLEYRQPYVAGIQAIGVEVLHHPYVTSVTQYLEQHGGEYPVIMLSRETVASEVMETTKRFAPNARVIFDTVDLHFLRIERQAEVTNDNEMRIAARKTRDSELGLIETADTTLVVSTMERDLLRELAPRADVQIIATIHEPTPGPMPFSERSGIVFIGGFRHPPNLDAVTWYVEHVLPILREKHPGMVTTVIGSNAPAWLQHYAAEDFIVAGFIEDVSPYYQSARLSIAPLRFGAGVKGKVNIAMQYGVPVVATSISVEGMNLTDEENVLVADDAEAFADAVIRLHTDEALWNHLRAGGLANIETWFSRKTARRALESLLKK
ncbi:MAG: glycosyltransferase [Betaproteobacteria bacterium]